MEVTLYHDTEHYRISFATPAQRALVPPEIVFICQRQQLPIIVARLEILSRTYQRSATTYFDEATVPFTLPSMDLFAQSLFGYADCGYITLGEHEARFHLPLQGATIAPYTAFTLQLLKTALLAHEPEDVPLGNGVQQCELDFCTDNFRENGYGHAVGGYLSGEVTTWLAAYLARETTHKYQNGDAPMHPSVVAAMKDTWLATARADWQEYVNECRGRITPDGAFILECFGNACDIGVYPSEFSPDDSIHSIACHNLDTVEQQLTLMAGLAEICTLARND